MLRAARTALRITCVGAVAVAAAIGTPAQAQTIETAVQAYGPYEGTYFNTLGIAAKLVYRAGTGSCGYQSCQAIYKPLEGRTVVFYSVPAPRDVLCSGVTDSAGIARCGSLTEKLRIIQDKGVFVNFAGDETYSYSEDSFGRS